MEIESVTADGEGADGGDLVLFDRVELGVELRYAGAGDDPAQSFRTRIAADGVYRANHRDLNKGCITLRLPMENSDGVEVGRATAELHLAEKPDGILIVTRRSSVRFNLLVPLRDGLAVPDDFVSADRKRNLVGPTTDVPGEACEQQLEFAQQVIRKLHAAVAVGLQESAMLVGGEMWLRAAEVCHDLICEDPVALTHAATRSPVPGTSIADHDYYRTKLYQNRIPVAHWLPKEQGETYKIYPKARQLLRVELSCGYRDRIASVIGRSSVPFTEEGIAEVFIDFYNSAGTLCCAGLDHVRNLARSTYSAADLALKLQPLLFIAARLPFDGGYQPNEVAAADAKRIYDEIVRSGVASAKGLRKGMKVRKVLDQLCGEDGPLSTGNPHGIYVLKPEYGRAGLLLDVGEDFEF